jgi:hypothetical protein
MCRAIALKLSAFVIAITLSPIPANAYCESGHWVSEVAGDGKIVILEDGSVWLIAAANQIDTMLWLPTTDITACDDKLIDTEDGEVAGARRIR